MPIVMITGGGKRMGKGLAIKFAEKKWDVVLLYNNSEDSATETAEYIKNIGSKVMLVKADITKSEQVDSAFQQVYDSFGVPDVLINNSGVFPTPTALTDISDELWDWAMDTNMKGAFLCSRAYARKAVKGARIIIIGSVGGLEVWKQRIPYNVSKAGLIHLAKALARELAPDITVNCINPGTIIMPDEKADSESDWAFLKKIPMGRYGAVDDIFEAAYFFATCTNYITGQILNVDGGFHDAK